MGSKRRKHAGSHSTAAALAAPTTSAADASSSGRHAPALSSDSAFLGSALGEIEPLLNGDSGECNAAHQQPEQRLGSSASSSGGRVSVPLEPEELLEASCSYGPSTVLKRSNRHQQSGAVLLNGMTPGHQHAHKQQPATGAQQLQKQHDAGPTRLKQQQHPQLQPLSTQQPGLQQLPPLPLQPLLQSTPPQSQQHIQQPIQQQNQHQWPVAQKWQQQQQQLQQQQDSQRQRQQLQQEQQQPQQQPRWEKVLWKQQPFPDTYTDATFLKELVVNADVPKRSYWRVVLGSAAVTQQISTVIAAVVVPVHLRQHNFTAHSVLAVCAVLLVVGYAICCFIGGHILGGSLRRGIRQVVLLTGGVYLLSPLLHSLTRTISEDSIIAMTVGLLILHLYLHDYNFVNSVTDKLTGTVSLGAAVLASVLIASGMPSEYDVFVHILFCLELYLLSPFMRRYIRQASLAAHIALTVGMVATAMGLLLPLSPNLNIVFLVVVVFISFLCPRWLVRIHKFKAKINGPWDEAVPQIPSVLMQPGWDGGGAATPAARLAKAT